MKQEWTDKLKDRLEDYSQPAPEGLWDDIEHSLKAKRSPFRFVAPLLAGVAAVAASVFVLLPGRTDSVQGIDVVETVPQITADLRIPEEPEDMPVNVESAMKNTYKRMIPTVAAQEEPLLTAVSGDEEWDVKDAEERKPATTTREEVSNQEIFDFPVFEDDTQNHASSKRGLSFGVQMGGMSTNNNGTSSHPFMAKDAIYGTFLAFDPEGFKTVNAVSARDYDWSVSFQTSAMARAYITQRISISTGAALTIMEGEQDYTNANKKAAYLGIPLNLNYDFLRLGNVKVGMNVGGSASMCVIKPADLEMNKWQLSASAGLNAVCPISKHAGIQAGIGSETFFASRDKASMFNRTTTLIKADLGLVWLLF